MMRRPSLSCGRWWRFVCTECPYDVIMTLASLLWLFTTLYFYFQLPACGSLCVNLISNPSSRPVTNKFLCHGERYTEFPSIPDSTELLECPFQFFSEFPDGTFENKEYLTAIDVSVGRLETIRRDNFPGGQVTTVFQCFQMQSSGWYTQRNILWPHPKLESYWSLPQPELCVYFRTVWVFGAFNGAKDQWHCTELWPIYLEVDPGTTSWNSGWKQMWPSRTRP